LLPVQKVPGRRDLERVAQNRGPAVGRRAQSKGLGPQDHLTVITVDGLVVESDMDRHRESTPASLMDGDAIIIAGVRPNGRKFDHD